MINQDRGENKERVNHKGWRGKEGKDLDSALFEAGKRSFRGNLIGAMANSKVTLLS